MKVISFTLSMTFCSLVLYIVYPIEKRAHVWTSNGDKYTSSHIIGWLVGFVALRPKSTAMVIAGRSVHPTTLFPGQA